MTDSDPENDYAEAIENAAADYIHTMSRKEVRDEVAVLSQLVGLLLDAHLQGTKLDATEEPLRGLLQKRREFGTTEGTGIIIGKAKCPECGAVVNDALGVTAETCVFCGTTISTER